MNVSPGRPATTSEKEVWRNARHALPRIAVHRGHTLRTTSAIGNGNLESPDRGQYTESANTPSTYPVPESPRTEKPGGKHTPVRVSISLLFGSFYLHTRRKGKIEREREKNALLSVGHADAAGNEDNEACESLGKGFAKWCNKCGTSKYGLRTTCTPIWPVRPQCCRSDKAPRAHYARCTCNLPLIA